MDAGNKRAPVQDDEKLRLYMAHRAALIGYATPIVGSRVQAEDIVQEAYLRFAPSASNGAALDHPVGYLYRIVRNLSLDLRRRLSAETRRDEAHAVLTDPFPAAPSPEEEALFRDELKCVDRALAELPDHMRKAFEMHRLGGYTFEQIAAHLGTSVSSAGRWVQQAFVHVSRRLESGGE